MITFNMLGSQGSGKGTQAKNLANHFGFILIEAGGSLRRIKESGSEQGQEIASYIDYGRRVTPEIISEVTRDAVRQVPRDKDILFEGFFRGLDELEAQRKVFAQLDLPLPVIIFLRLEDETALSRLSKRRICERCGSQAIVEAGSPSSCQQCGGALIIRHDDRPEAIRERINWYHRDTEPVIDWFRTHGQVIDIDAAPSIDIVSKEAIEKIDAYLASIGKPHDHN